MGSSQHTHFCSAFSSIPTVSCTGPPALQRMSRASDLHPMSCITGLARRSPKIDNSGSSLLLSPSALPRTRRWSPGPSPTSEARKTSRSGSPSAAAQWAAQTESSARSRHTTATIVISPAPTAFSAAAQRLPARRLARRAGLCRPAVSKGRGRGRKPRRCGSWRCLRSERTASRGGRCWRTGPRRLPRRTGAPRTATWRWNATTRCGRCRAARCRRCSGRASSSRIPAPGSTTRTTMLPTNPASTPWCSRGSGRSRGRLGAARGPLRL